jgi:ribosomal protein S18 acetylase RimI-like enzyme
VRVRRLQADEWETLRELRLRALADAPEAFARTHAEEAAYPEALWRRRAAGGPDAVTFVADAGEPPGVGLATVLLEGPDDVGPRRGHLVGMWVDPACRRQGVARGLIDQAAGWARARGAAELVLWVVDRNAAARRLYERAGFRPTGHRQPLPSRPELSESRLRLEL